MRPSWSPRAPLMAAVSADSLDDRAPLAFSSLSNQPSSCRQEESDDCTMQCT